MQGQSRNDGQGLDTKWMSADFMVHSKQVRKKEPKFTVRYEDGELVLPEGEVGEDGEVEEEEGEEEEGEGEEEGEEEGEGEEEEEEGEVGEEEEESEEESCVSENGYGSDLDSEVEEEIEMEETIGEVDVDLIKKNAQKELPYTFAGIVTPFHLMLAIHGCFGQYQRP